MISPKRYSHPGNALVIIGRFRRPLVIQEKACPHGSSNFLERTRLHAEVEEALQVAVGARIGEAERALTYVEHALDELQNAAEVVAIVVDISGRCVRRNDNQGDAKPVLIVALPLIWHRQERGRRN